MSNMYEPDIERVFTFDLALTPIEIGMILVALRAHARHLEKSQDSLVKKLGDEYDPTVHNEKRETIDSIKTKIRKAGYG